VRRDGVGNGCRDVSSLEQEPIQGSPPYLITGRSPELNVFLVVLQGAAYPAYAPFPIANTTGPNAINPGALGYFTPAAAKLSFVFNYATVPPAATNTTTVGIDYMDTASGLALLDEVYQSATSDEYVYAHQWQVGDLVVWDNGFTMHRRTPFDPGARRLMKRMTMTLDRHQHVVPDGRLAQSEVGMPI